MNLSFYFCASAAAMCAIFYGVELSNKEVSLHRSIIKTASTAILMLAAIILGAPKLLIILLAVAATGDFLISMRHEQGFLASLGPFAVVRLIVISLFLQHSMGIEILLVELWRALLLITLVGVALGVCWKMWPKLGQLRWPVLGFSSIVVTMGAVALTLTTNWPMHFGLIAAGLFILSDALIGLVTFAIGEDEPLSHKLGFVTWFSYFSALVCLLAAFT